MGWNTYDLTGLYKNWLNGVCTNFGIELVATLNDNTVRCIASADNTSSTIRPKLEITLNEPPATTPTPHPTPTLRPTPTPGPTPTPSVLALALWNFDDGNDVVDGGLVTSATFIVGGTLANTSFTSGNPASGFAHYNTGWDTEAPDPARSWMISLDTTGYQDIALEFDERRSNTGPLSFVVYVSGNGGASYTTATLLVPTNLAFAATPMHLFDFASKTIMNNNPQTRIQVRAYGASNAMGAWRIDNIRVTGRAFHGPTPTPQPTLSPTPRPTASPTPNVTATPSPIPTASASPTPSPSASHTPTPLPSIVIIQPGPSNGKDAYFGTVYAQSGTYKDEGMLVGGWGDFYYAFLQFDLTTAPAANLVAKVELKLYQLPSNGVNDPGLQIYRITSNWTDSGITSINYPTSEFYKAAGTTSLGWNTYDLTGLYKNWLNGDCTNFGFELVATLNDNTVRCIASADNTSATIRPKLEITLIEPPEITPTPHASPTPRQSPTPQPSATPTPTNTLELLREYLAGRRILPPQNSDANGDGRIDAADLIWMLNHLTTSTIPLQDQGQIPAKRRWIELPLNRNGTSRDR
ncbi:MAG: DNRLRE domain-containing protein [Candidatus Sumerlaeota bacterium]|nr:DNRLRE domain-containing protein [Candidatus Sumerlaeota bacterium]